MGNGCEPPDGFSGQVALGTPPHGSSWSSWTHTPGSRSHGETAECHVVSFINRTLPRADRGGERGDRGAREEYGEPATSPNPGREQVRTPSAGAPWKLNAEEL